MFCGDRGPGNSLKPAWRAAPGGPGPGEIGRQRGNQEARQTIMEVAERIRESLDTLGPRLAAVTEARGFVERVRRLAETGLETAEDPGQVAGIFERLLSLCSLAEETAGELWAQTKTRAKIGPTRGSEVCPPAAPFRGQAW